MKWDDVPKIESLEELLTAKGIASILGISPMLVNTWRVELDLPYVRLGKIAYYSKTQVVNWMDNYQRTVPDKTAILGRALAERARQARIGKKK